MAQVAGYLLRMDEALGAIPIIYRQSKFCKRSRHFQYIEETGLVNAPALPRASAHFLCAKPKVLEHSGRIQSRPSFKLTIINSNLGYCSKIMNLKSGIQA
jgi:hypothetical protein